jgi:hypothetical protein
LKGTNFALLYTYSIGLLVLLDKGEYMTSDVITGLILSVVGIALSAIGIILTIKAREKREPKCVYKTYRNIVKLSNEGKLKISYDGIEVDRICTTYIFFWNKGNKEIKKGDIPKPLEIDLSDEKELYLLDFKVIKVSRDAINLVVSQCWKHTLQIDFDFLDKNDGAVIEVKHTGSIHILPSINGTILGVHEGVKVKALSQRIAKRKDTKSILIGYFVLAFGIILFPFSVFLLWNEMISTSRIYMILIIISIFATISLIIPTTLGFISQNNLPYPKSLDIDLDIKPY